MNTMTLEQRRVKQQQDLEAIREATDYASATPEARAWVASNHDRAWEHPDGYVPGLLALKKEGRSLFPACKCIGALLFSCTPTSPTREP